MHNIQVHKYLYNKLEYEAVYGRTSMGVPVSELQYGR